MGDVLPPGTRLGRYEIVQRLALGGMAEIYLARASGLAGFAKHVVLKRILPGHARDPEFVRMFFNEARYAATLDHPNIAHVYDLGEDQGLHYFTMEYLHGEDCRTLLRELQVRGQRLPLEHALTIVTAAANGCHFAHELTDEAGAPLGLVHRDVSPSNVVVTYAGAVKLVDFGIAKATNLEDVTAVGATKGKVAYMAPEQCKSEPLDRRVDVYALGVLLYELTTTSRAFHGDNDAAVMWSVVTGATRPPGEVVPGYPDGLARIVTRAMHVDRGERFATARELQQALEGFAREAGLALAHTALGDWLEQTCGPKVEPWRSGEGPAARRSATAPPPVAAPVSAPAPVPAPAPAPVSAPVSAPAPAPAPARWPWMVAALILAGSASAAIAIVVPKLRAAEAPAGAGAVVLVTERGSAAIEGDGEATIDARTAEATDASVATVAVDGGAKAAPPRPPRAPAGDPLSLAFARRQAAVKACFERHSQTIVGQPEVTLRFEIDARGVPTSVEVFPAAVASTALGGCLVEVGRGTRFPAQAAPIAFRIPVSVRRQGGT
ncbi:MAG TPA: protein kinase [Kofleriaceae bacterium]|nr:protein kinase [Kofleriaceae bacterium]